MQIAPPDSKSAELKRCEACRRSLPIYSMFNRRSRNRDGFSNCCRQCHGYRVKNAYRVKVPYSYVNRDVLVVYPIKDANRCVLDSLLQSKAFTVRGTTMDSRELILLHVDTRVRGVQSFEITTSAGESKIKIVHSGDFNSFLRYLGSALYEREIRLHLTEECDI